MVCLGQKTGVAVRMKQAGQDIHGLNWPFIRAFTVGIDVRYLLDSQVIHKPVMELTLNGPQTHFAKARSRGQSYFHNMKAGLV